MATDLKEREKIRNPGDEHAEKLFPSSLDLANAEKSSTDMSDFENSFKNDTADSSQEDANIKKAKEREGSGGNKPPSIGKSSSSSRQPKPPGPAPSSRMGKALNFTKKAGPLAPIMLVFILSFSVLLITFLPGLAIKQLTDSIVSSLHDAFGNIELRSNHLHRSRLKNKPLKGMCATGVQMRCKYKTMSDTQVSKFKAAGVEISPEPGKTRGGPSGRHKVESLSYHDANGKVRTVKAKDFNAEYRKNPVFTKKMNQVYPSKFKTARGPRMLNFLMNKIKTGISRKLNGTKSQMKKQVDSNVNKGVDVDMSKRRMRTEVDGDGNTKLVDSSTGKDIDRGKYPSLADDASKAETRLNEARTSARKGSSSFKRGLTGANILFGAEQLTCELLKMVEVASTASRILARSQLIRFFLLYANTGDSSIAMEASPEAVEFVGQQITTVDTRPMVATSEDSIGDGNSGNLMDNIRNANSQNQISPSPNPHYGKNAFDSTGVKTVTYGSAGELDMRESQFIVGGGLGAQVDAVIQFIRNMTFIGGAIDNDTCNRVNNTGMQYISMAAGIFFMALGGPAAAARSLPLMIASQVAMWYINAKIEDLFNGTLANGETKGLDLGNAAMSGGGQYLSSAASVAGVTPASTYGDIANMAYINNLARTTEAQMARYEARDTPFDVYNKYSFLGSIVWGINPSTLHGMGKLQLMAMAPFKILSSIPSIIAPNSMAQSLHGKERFSQCKDPIFTGGNIPKEGEEPDENGINLQSADIMCNVRYAQTPIHLNADPERVVDWMIDAVQVDASSGEPINNRTDMVNLDNDNNRTSKEVVGAAEAGEDPANNSDNPPIKVFPETSSVDVRSSVAEVLRPDDDTLADLGIPIDTPSDKLAQFNPGYKYDVKLANQTDPVHDRRYYPPPINRDVDFELEGVEDEESEEATNDEYVPEKDVRTYAHWFRYCRDGPDDGRKVPIGVPDGEEPEDLLGEFSFGLIKKQYVSDGRECLRSNKCKAGQDPNGADWSNKPSKWHGEKPMRKRCFPPQYEIYSIYLMDKQTDESMDELDDEGDTSASGDWAWPTTKSAIITSGHESNPTNGRPDHKGSDIAHPGGSQGKPIFASDGGEVIEAGPASGFGNWIVIKHDVNGKRFDTVYGHMYDDGVDVKKGDKVKRGDKIGEIGNNGASSGYHIHFEIWDGGRHDLPGGGGKDIDPGPLIEKNKDKAPDS